MSILETETRLLRRIKETNEDGDLIPVPDPPETPETPELPKITKTTKTTENPSQSLSNLKDDIEKIKQSYSIYYGDSWVHEQTFIQDAKEVLKNAPLNAPLNAPALPHVPMYPNEDSSTLSPLGLQGLQAWCVNSNTGTYAGINKGIRTYAGIDKGKWLKDTQQTLEAHWGNSPKLCNACGLNQIPLQFDTCTVCNNKMIEANGSAYFADSLGRKYFL